MGRDLKGDEGGVVRREHSIDGCQTAKGELGYLEATWNCECVKDDKLIGDCGVYPYSSKISYLSGIVENAVTQKDYIATHELVSSLHERSIWNCCICTSRVSNKIIVVSKVKISIVGG